MCLHLKLLWQELVNGPAGWRHHTYPEFSAVCKSESQRNKRSWHLWEEYLEGELLVENRIEGLPVDLGLKLLLFVR